MTISTQKGWQFPIRILLFWMLFFGLFRVFFIKINIPASGASEIWQNLRAALPLDASMAAWAAGLPIIFWAIGLFFQKNWLKNSSICLSRACIAVFTVICAANVFLYKDWSAVINRRAISYLKTPLALFNSLSKWELVGSVLLLVFCWSLFGKMFDRLVVRHGFFWEKRPVWQRIAAILVVFSASFACLRGLGTMPINESAVYFSANNFSNHAAVNPVWHLFHDFVEERAVQNPFVFFEKSTAKKMVAPLFPADSIQQPVLKLGETNIVFIILESMSARMFDDSARTPNLHKLARLGSSFSDIYGSGFRTDQGIVSILSGYPAQPDQSILMLSDKAEKLPGLPRFFKKNNYSTLFCYGGDLTFANLGVYLRSQNFQKIVSKKEFPSAEISQKWGADDDKMLNRFASELDGLPQPFFASALTLSLHPPFDLPGDAEIEELSRREKFRRAATFTDQAIGLFFEKIGSKPWFENTIFVLTADHGHSLPDEISLESGASRRVPLIFFGKNWPRDFSQKLLEQTSCQHDLPASMLALFGAQNIDYQWSRNIFSTQTSPFSYWSNEVALGWKDPAGEHIFDFTKKNWTSGSPSPTAQAYLQVLYDDFLDK